MAIDDDMRTNAGRAGARPRDVPGARRRRASRPLFDPQPAGAGLGRFSGSPRRARDADLPHRDVRADGRSFPSVAAAVYYGFIASNQYVAEAQFTVMGGGDPGARTR